MMPVEFKPEELANETGENDLRTVYTCVFFCSRAFRPRRLMQTQTVGSQSGSDKRRVPYYLIHVGLLQRRSCAHNAIVSGAKKRAATGVGENNDRAPYCVYVKRYVATGKHTNAL